MPTPSQHIFTTEITHQDGKKTWEISSQPLSDASIRLNTKNNRLLLLSLMALSSEGTDNSYLHLSVINRLIYYRGMVPDVWGNIFGFLRGFTRNAGDYALSIMSIRQSSLFKPDIKSKKIAANPSVAVDAAMRGQEDVVLNTLQDDPSTLLKKTIVKNSVGVEHKVTAAQAAVIANDIQLIEKMQAHFERLTTDLSGNAIDGLVEMQNQIKAIYIESLQNYCDMQKAVLEKLEAKQLQLLELPPDLFKAQERQYDEIQKNIQVVVKAIRNDTFTLQCNDIQKIIEAHNQAQEHNAFDFDPYVNAILSAPDAELDAVMELINATTQAETDAAITRTGVAPKETDVARLKSFDELTLVEKLNRFREELVKHMQQEIIFNPNHILNGLKHNEETWDAVDAGRIADPGYQKRSIIFSQLAGWAQRNADEPVRQDMRQGTWYLTENNESRTRQSRFNEYRDGRIVPNSLVDVSLVNSSVVGGGGYKFGGCVAVVRRVGCGALRRRFSKLMSNKNSKLSELITKPTPASRARRCVIQ